MINVADVVVDQDFAQTLSIRRTTGGYDNKGRWGGDVPTEFTAVGSWQRVSARELNQLGIGEIKQEVRKFLTTANILIAEDDDKLSDRIIDGTKRYKVIRIDDNGNFGYIRNYATFEGNE